ncbi:MAG: 1,4-alpha-glucan branching protein GlgB [Desulfarculus sp.]|jgi:1,4-alpha-glucan branching enzyme|nr:MAG: 1,4-alpha-glucan branching protein GlgB [Desulfarculus sp.]
MNARKTQSGQVSLLSEDDLYLFNQGSHLLLYDKLGAHPLEVNGTAGTYFAVWAPNAHAVFVMGDFNGWDQHDTPLKPRGSSGIWEGFRPGVGLGQRYKYHIESKNLGYQVDKADPLAFQAEEPPLTASVVSDLSYQWGDGDWLARRAAGDALERPMAIYEVHLGSWRRGEDGRRLGYREIAPLLADYCLELGFTHVELMPVMEHPFYGSWGYQTTGYFAPSRRYGSLQDFMFLVDHLHQRGIGLILDWVPSHFPDDGHGLSFFDGTHLYEHADPRQGYHPDWHSAIFNYGRDEVRSFLLSSAMFWLKEMHADGLRVDAVASMLYLDYSRRDGEWIPNQYGGNENLEAVQFLQRLNQETYAANPGVQNIAEESTAWPMVSRPTYLGGLGFGLKWDMGWMHDTLSYFRRQPVHRKFHHNQLTFRMLYAFTENFVLALSHDEVVHGKGSLLGKMPGDDWQKFANLRLLYCYQYGQPAKKLLFMGGEFGQWAEWSHEAALDWHLLAYPPHQGLQRLVSDLNRLYARQPALQEDLRPGGFEWVDCNDADNSVLAFLRWGRQGQALLVVCNFTPVPRSGYWVGVNQGGPWREVLNSDAEIYGGSGWGNLGGLTAGKRSTHGRPYSLNLTLPPLAAVFLQPAGQADL